MTILNSMNQASWFALDFEFEYFLDVGRWGCKYADGGDGHVAFGRTPWTAMIALMHYDMITSQLDKSDLDDIMLDADEMIRTGSGNRFSAADFISDEELKKAEDDFFRSGSKIETMSVTDFESQSLR